MRGDIAMLLRRMLVTKTYTTRLCGVWRCAAAEATSESDSQHESGYRRQFGNSWIWKNSVCCGMLEAANRSCGATSTVILGSTAGVGRIGGAQIAAPGDTV